MTPHTLFSRREAAYAESAPAGTYPLSRQACLPKKFMAEYIENGKIQIYNKFNEWLCRRSLRGREVNLL